MKRYSIVTWKGTGKEGSGEISTQSGVLNKVRYAWKSRFEESPGTNPEELIAAAHAGCFTMKLSFLLTEAGFKPELIETKAEVKLEKDTISQSHLIVKAIVPGMSEEKFLQCAEFSRANCIVSRVLKADITMEAALTEKITA